MNKCQCFMQHWLPSYNGYASWTLITSKHLIDPRSQCFMKHGHKLFLGAISSIWLFICCYGFLKQICRQTKEHLIEIKYIGQQFCFICSFQFELQSVHIHIGMWLAGFPSTGQDCRRGWFLNMKPSLCCIQWGRNHLLRQQQFCCCGGKQPEKSHAIYVSTKLSLISTQGIIFCFSLVKQKVTQRLSCNRFVFIPTCNDYRIAANS